MTTVSPIPEGFHTATPYLIARDAAGAIAFYEKAFEATELFRLNTPDGKVAHAEFKIGDSIVMISEENPQCGSASPQALGGSPVTVHLYVEDADRVFAQAVEAGAQPAMPVDKQFWGDRMGKVIDPFGHHWLIATRVEDVDPNDYQSRMDAWLESQGH